MPTPEADEGQGGRSATANARDRLEHAPEFTELPAAAAEADGRDGGGGDVLEANKALLQQQLQALHDDLHSSRAEAISHMSAQQSAKALKESLQELATGGNHSVENVADMDTVTEASN